MIYNLLIRLGLIEKPVQPLDAAKDARFSQALIRSMNRGIKA